MGYFDDNRKVQFSDLEASGRYSIEVMDAIKDIDTLYKLKNLLDEETKKEKDFMEPLMYAVKNEKGTYAIYEYYDEILQNDEELAIEIIKEEPNLIENTPLSEQKEFILKVAEINPKVISHMSQDLKIDSQFTGELCNLENKEVTQYAAIECKMPDTVLENPELAANETFMKQAVLENVNSLEHASDELKNDYNFMKEISKSEEVIDYVVEHTEQFGKEALTAAKETLVEVSSEKAKSGFEEESKKIQEQIAEKQEENESLEELLKRDKQLQRHINFFERIQKGEVDPVRAAKLMDKLCKNMDPQYKQKISQLIGLDKAIDEKSKKMLESAVEATEESVRTEQINNEADKISEIQKSKDETRETEESTLE